MFKSLKRKFNFIYISIIFILILIVGVTSTLNLYQLRQSIDGVIKDNYTSINDSNEMSKILSAQDNAIITYFINNEPSKKILFYENSPIFYKWYNAEIHNITEPGEKQVVDNINSVYTEYLLLFPKLIKIRNEQGIKSAMELYTSKSKPLLKNLNDDLKELNYINSKAMFNKKAALKKSSETALLFVLVSSCSALFIGFFISRFFTNKLLKPIYSLNQTITSIKEGNLNATAPIFSEDELGELTLQFNKMLNRLKLFEESTAGQLMTEKNKSLAIVKSISDPLVVLNTDYKIILLNNAFEEVFNIQEHEVLNKHFLEILQNKELFNYISSALQNHTKDSASKIIEITNNNKEYYFNITNTIVNDMDSKISGVVIFFQNVTKLKQLEKMKANFISTISHEFKTPLTSIMMGASLICDENIGYLNPKQLKIIKTIIDEGDKLTELVTTLLQLSKIESGKSIFNIEPYSIIGIVEKSIQNFYGVAENNQLSLFYDIDDTLPKVLVDGEKISWVVNNLISNALKYTNAGDTISITAFVEHGKMCVVVKDTGMGIPKEYLSKIFNKFTQVAGYDNEFIGTGLGLNISKEIVEAHGGEIWCESKLDVGSSFIFTLPLLDILQ